MRVSTVAVTDRPGRSCLRHGTAVVVQFDPDRHALDDFREIAGGVLRRQQSELRAAAGRQADDSAVQMDIGEGVHRDIDLLAAEHPLDLRLLEVRDDVDAAAERDDRHQPRAGLNILPDPHRQIADPAVDRRMNIGAAEIEPRRLQRGAGAAQCRLGLVALGVQHIELSGRRLDGALVVLQCGLFGEQVGLGLLRALHGRVTALGKLLKPGIFLPCKRQIGLGRRYIGARLRDDRFLQRDLGVDVADIGLGRVDVGLGFRDRSGVVARIDPHQHLAGLDMLVVGDEQLVHITGDLRRDHGHVGRRIGIVGRFEPAQRRVPVPAEIGRDAR